MGNRSHKQFRPSIQAPASLRLGLPHLLLDVRNPRVRPDPRHAIYVRIRELRLA